MSPVARILDANANRAREALRVMEDIARFVLNDDVLCGDLKASRHALCHAIEALPIDSAQLLAARDTPGDVGTSIKGAGEMDRAGLTGVAAAAGARLSESLRSLEEAAKAIHSPTAAREFEAARYSAYTLDQRLRIALGIGRSRQWRLSVLLTEALCTHHPWQHVAELALAGGVDCIQLREKSLEGGELVRRAEWLVQIARSFGASVIVNDRADVAIAAGADGVHLGQTDLRVEHVRRFAGHRLLVGVSTSNIEQARDAVRDGADYCGVGPMFHTTTKHKDVIVGPGYLREYLADAVTSRVPHLAIGGIDVARAKELSDIGCEGNAVSSAVCGARDPKGVVEQFLEIGVKSSRAGV